MHHRVVNDDNQPVIKECVKSARIRNDQVSVTIDHLIDATKEFFHRELKPNFDGIHRLPQNNSEPMIPTFTRVLTITNEDVIRETIHYVNHYK